MYVYSIRQVIVSFSKKPRNERNLGKKLRLSGFVFICFL